MALKDLIHDFAVEQNLELFIAADKFSNVELFHPIGVFREEVCKRL